MANRQNPPQAPAEAAPVPPEAKGIDIYKNISHVKLHTSMGVIWPGEEVMLKAEEAKAFAGKVISRT